MTDTQDKERGLSERLRKRLNNGEFNVENFWSPIDCKSVADDMKEAADALDRLTTPPAEPAPVSEGELADKIVSLGLTVEGQKTQTEIARGIIESLKKALEEIANSHVPDQPEAYNFSERDWAYRHVGTLRLIAQSALAAASQPERKGCHE